MRISDWSSDVCSSDLPRDLRDRLQGLERRNLRLLQMIRLGEDLAAALFPPRARSFLERSLEKLEDDEGLRVRLRLDTYALADLQIGRASGRERVCQYG